jgi:hydroxymethylpyrimidine pyrophosphatase-like HAD family hydrolase
LHGKEIMNSTQLRSSGDKSKVLPPVIGGSGLQNFVQEAVLPAELEFYQSYHWSLNPHLTVREAIGRLGEEVEKVSIVPSDWEIGEVATNIFLLSCGLLNCVDGHLRGLALRLPGRVGRTVVGRGANRFAETISAYPWSQRRVGRLRDQWRSHLDNFLKLIVSQRAVDAKRLSDSGHKLARLGSLLPRKLLGNRLAIPSPFSHLDLTPNDVLLLGRIFMQRFPGRAQPLLIVGMRTAGSYFAPLLRALLETEGYRSVELLTVEPLKGVGRREERELKRFATRGCWALIVDDPPDSSRTLLAASDILRRAGFAAGNVKFLAPTHPASPTWFKTLPESSVITLLPEQWHKYDLLNSKVVELRLGEYFRSRNFARVSVAASRRADEFNALIKNTASDERGVRLKRIFEVRLETPEGKKQTQYVLAKSVGWGWLSYRAFLMAHRLTEFVPPLLGLRDGILYMEWIPQSTVETDNKRNVLLEASAVYVAARVRRLNLGAAAGIDLKRYNNASRLLEKAFSRAYGRFPADLLMRSRVGGLVRDVECPCSTLVDGNMNSDEWILGPRGPLKTDYEHHAMGKTALNVTDPAYDLADTILDLALSPEQESSLIKQYIAESGDATVARRLFTHKLLAGLWAMNQTQQQLLSSHPRGRDAQRDYHLRFMNAWNFLTVQTARYCGSLCDLRSDMCWRAPLIVLDLDGVLDRRVFGFPCTTAAGIQALSLLSAHDFSVALNTARSAAEVKDYCKAYSLAGGVAEHGGYLWDAVRQRERVLISAETVRQLQELRRHLQGVPGVFLDERHQYSIRAFTYRKRPLGLIDSLLSSAHSASVGDGALAPISTHILYQMLVDLRLDRLAFHHTTIDTAIVAKEADKGTGLTALRNFVLGDDAETIAVGDTEHDLPMFRMASRSFAPSNINCRVQAQLLGCQIAHYAYQRGLLEIVTKIIDANKERCEQCPVTQTGTHRIDDLFMTVLQAADQTWTKNLASVIFNPAAYRIFIR